MNYNETPIIQRETFQINHSDFQNKFGKRSKINSDPNNLINTKIIIDNLAKFYEKEEKYIKYLNE